MMSELFETLPEAGDRDKPKMVFFFDEAHLLFKSASKALLEKIEQVVKLIRSKGVGIYFISQSPKDIPDGVLGQLGNKIQHALHAYTPAEQKGAKVAAQSFRANPEFDTYEALTQLGIGEALVSVLDENGVPTVVKKCNILPPQSQMGVLDDATRNIQITDNLLYTKYAQMIDRESAYELLEKMVIEAEKTVKESKEAQKRETARKREMQSTVKKVASSATGTIGREIGNQIGQSIGGSFGKRLGGNVGASLGRGILSTLFK
jgi:hypothetical protein